METVTTFDLGYILPKIFTTTKRASLRGVPYGSSEWADSSRLKIKVNNKYVYVSLGTHTLQTFAKKDGIVCKKCGAVGKKFVVSGSNGKYVLNLIAIKDGKEVLMTKDHIVPRSVGGANHISNYQTLCYKCNIDKGCVW